MKAASFVLAVVLVAFPTATFAQVAPHKLIISWYQSNLIVVDYPSKERCEAAAMAVNAEVARRLAESDARAPQGSVRISTGPNGAFCIPG